MKYTDEQLREMLSGHHHCGWVSEGRTGCDCGYYDALNKKDPETAKQICEFIERGIKGKSN